MAETIGPNTEGQITIALLDGKTHTFDGLYLTYDLVQRSKFLGVPTFAFKSQSGADVTIYLEHITSIAFKTYEPF